MSARRVVTREELLARGMSRRAIEHQIAIGRLFVLYRGVYAVGRPDLSPMDQRLAAVRALGPGAFLSHTSAGQVWDLVGGALHPVHVTVTGSGRVQRRGIRAHRTTNLHPADLTEFDGLPITGVARTLVDMAAILNRPRLTRAVEQAERTQRLDLLGLRQLLDRHPCAPGAATLRAILATYDGAPDTRSELERRFLEFVMGHRLPQPLLNHPIAGFLVDAYWPHWRLVVELDSVRFHFTRRGFQEDRRRDAVLQLHGLRVLRLTAERLRTEPRIVLAEIHAFAAGA
jgi:very-short-patch-repair endonuclease